MSKLVIWINSPSHYQRSFYAALRESMDLVVRYYLPLPEDRKVLGWSDAIQTDSGEEQAPHSIPEALNTVPDWMDRVHIVPRDIIHSFPRQMAVHLSQRDVQWVAWGERSFKGWKWIATYPLKRWYALLVNRHARGVFAIGNTAIKDYSSWGIQRDKIEFLPYVTPIPNKDIIPDPKIAEFTRNAGIVFMFLGVLCKRKGVDILIKAFAEVFKRNSSARLVLVGNDASKGYYKRLATGMGVERAVLLAGPKSPDSLYQCLTLADVVVLPSRYDGWGVVLNEGASMGKALIGTDACGASDHLIVENYNGFNIPAANVELLAEKMEFYSQKPDSVIIHGNHSSIIFEQFTPERNVQRLQDAFVKWGII